MPHTTRKRVAPFATILHKKEFNQDPLESATRSLSHRNAPETQNLKMEYLLKCSVRLQRTSDPWFWLYFEIFNTNPKSKTTPRQNQTLEFWNTKHNPSLRLVEWITKHILKMTNQENFVTDSPVTGDNSVAVGWRKLAFLFFQNRRKFVLRIGKMHVHSSWHDCDTNAGRTAQENFLYIR